MCFCIPNDISIPHAAVKINITNQDEEEVGGGGEKHIASRKIKCASKNVSCPLLLSRDLPIFRST